MFSRCFSRSDKNFKEALTNDFPVIIMCLRFFTFSRRKAHKERIDSEKPIMIRFEYSSIRRFAQSLGVSTAVTEDNLTGRSDKRLLSHRKF